MSAVTPMTFVTSFMSLRRFFEARHGAGSFQKVREALRDEQAITLPPIFTPASWYPTIWFLKGMDAAAARYGTKDFYDQFGATAAEFEINVLFRFALRFKTPAWLLERGGQEWHKAHNTGVWEVEAGDSRMRGTLRDFCFIHEGQCRSLTAWFRRAGQMTGATKIKVWHPYCRAQGAPACVFDGEW